MTCDAKQKKETRDWVKTKTAAWNAANRDRYELLKTRAG
jgi:hypothetical protein